MNCKKCNTPIVLSPSASDRAKNSQHSAEYYTEIFTVCSKCQIKSWYSPVNKPSKNPLLKGI